jgi:hypothetical protein
MKNDPSRSAHDAALMNWLQNYKHKFGLIVLTLIGVLALACDNWILLSTPVSSSRTTEEEAGAGDDNSVRSFSSVGTMNDGDDKGYNSTTTTSSSSSMSHGYKYTTTKTTAREMVGEWLGQNWVPPHSWRLFGPTELLEMYQDTRMLWIGDSTGRRAFATLYAILNETAIAAASNSNKSSNSSQQRGGTEGNDRNSNDNGPHHVPSVAMDHPSVIDVNKKTRTEFCNKWTSATVASAELHNLNYPVLCRPTPPANRNDNSRLGGEFSLAIANCYNTIENMLSSELAGTTNITADVDVIVIATGIWEVMRISDCTKLEDKTNTTRRSPLQRLNDTLTVAAKFTSVTGKIILWRTGGYGHASTVNPMNVLNNLTMDFIDGNNMNSKNNSNNNKLMYINWGGTILPRSFGDDNIPGDLIPHYGTYEKNSRNDVFCECIISTCRRLTCSVHYFTCCRPRSTSGGGPNDHQSAP